MFFLPYLLLYKKNAPAAIIPKTAAPPTSPPTIAPVLLLLLSLGVVEVCTGAAVPEVVEEDDIVLTEVEVEELEDVAVAADFEESDAAELSRTARWTVLKFTPLSPLNVV